MAKPSRYAYLLLFIISKFEFRAFSFTFRLSFAHGENLFLRYINVLI